MSGGQTWGFDSIGAVATKKPYGSRAVQETFPTVFADTFAEMGSPQAYLPDSGIPHAQLQQGDDFQAGYHAQKKRDADYMAHAKVQSTRMMNTRAFSSKDGYYELPSAVLGQRQFANETGGAYSTTSTRQAYADAPFHYSDAHGARGGSNGVLTGGVLRTAEGQGYAKGRLVDRVAQLNAIEANAGNFTQDPRNKISAPTSVTQSIGAVQQGATSEGTQAKTELYLLLQNLNDSLVGDDTEAGSASAGDVTRFTYQDTTRVLGLLFRLTPTLEPYDLNDILDLVSGIQTKLLAIVGDQNAVSAEKYETALSLITLMEKANEYLREFVRQTTTTLDMENISEGRPTKTDVEKLQISKSLVQTLGFARSLRDARQKMRDAIQASQDEFYADNESGPISGEFGSTSGSGRGGARTMDLDPQIRYATRDARSSARFSQLAPTRETTRALQIERQSGLGTFDVDERGSFGMNAGHYYPTGGRDVGYTEEGIDGPPEPSVVARISTEPSAPVVKAGVPDVRGRYDEDTQQFDVETRGSGKKAKKVDLPKTREGFVELANKINAMPEGQRPTKDGKKIQVYASSTLASLRKNFKRRLDL
jgi:hypothetical protein